MFLLPGGNLVRNPEEREAAVPGLQGGAILLARPLSAAEISAAPMAEEGATRHLRDGVDGRRPTPVSIGVHLCRQEEREELLDRRFTALPFTIGKRTESGSVWSGRRQGSGQPGV